MHDNEKRGKWEWKSVGILQACKWWLRYTTKGLEFQEEWKARLLLSDSIQWKVDKVEFSFEEERGNSHWWTRKEEGKCAKNETKNEWRSMSPKLTASSSCSVWEKKGEAFREDDDL